MTEEHPPLGTLSPLTGNLVKLSPARTLGFEKTQMRREKGREMAFQISRLSVWLKFEFFIFIFTLFILTIYIGAKPSMFTV